MDRLGELQTFLAILEAGSLAGAARQLGRSAPSVTRDLAQLESRIGTALVERSTRACATTPAGRRLAEQARQLLAGYAEMVLEASGEVSVAEGGVRMTAPVMFGRDHVWPLVLPFLEAHPAISIDLQLADRLVDLIEEDFDLAVRIGPLPDSALISRQVGAVRRMKVASPDYLMRRGAPQTPKDLRGHDIVQHAARGPLTPWAFRMPEGRNLSLEVDGRITVNNPDLAIDAARAGAGIVNVLSYQVDSDLQSGRLVRLLTKFEPEAIPVSLVWPESRRRWRRMRLLLDHFAAGLSALPAVRREA